MPHKRVFCVSIRDYAILADVETEADLPGVVRDEWGRVCVDWIAVKAEREAEAMGKALAWRGRPLADRERQSVATGAWLAVASLVTCGTCS